MRKFKYQIVSSVILLLGVAGFALAQQVDPCAIYPHKFANVPQGTPTVKVVAGVAGQRIYVCGVVVPQSGATPALTLSYGEVVAATPCATSTPGGNIGQFGGSGVNTVGQQGNFNTTIAAAPASVGTPVVDLCGLVAGGNGVAIGGAVVTYVQGP